MRRVGVLVMLSAAESALQRAVSSRESVRRRGPFPRRFLGSPDTTHHCDTRPFRGRALPAYAGCMTVVPAAPIDCVYSSRSKPVCNLSLWESLWVEGSSGGNFCFRWPPCPLGRGKQAVAWETPPTKAAKVAKWTGRFTRGPATKGARIHGCWPPWSGSALTCVEAGAIPHPYTRGGRRHGRPVAGR